MTKATASTFACSLSPPELCAVGRNWTQQAQAILLHPPKGRHRATLPCQPGGSPALSTRREDCVGLALSLGSRTTIAQYFPAHRPERPALKKYITCLTLGSPLKDGITLCLEPKHQLFISLPQSSQLLSLLSVCISLFLSLQPPLACKHKLSCPPRTEFKALY